MPEAINSETHCGQCGTIFGVRRRCYKCYGGGSPKAGEERVCPVCEKVFYAPKWKLDDTVRKQGKYCSRECKHRGQLELPATYRAVRQAPNGEIQCVKCGLVKPVAEYGKDSRKLNGLKSWCKTCSHGSVVEWREKYPEQYDAIKRLPKTQVQKLRRRDLDLQQHYRITLLEFQEILESQNGGCAVCGSPPSGIGKSGATLHVDHDHACCSGKTSCGECIRGLLCTHCNTLIGLAKDDPNLLLEAASYLRRRLPLST